MQRLLSFLFICCISSAGRAEDKLVGGPYVVNVGPRSATVMWLVESGSGTIGADPSKLEKTTTGFRSEKLTFTGLKAGTTYYYDTKQGEQGKGSFKTAPAAGASSPFQFVVYGDTRTRHEVHRAVAAAVLKYAQPDFIVHTGDQVADGYDTALWPIFFDIERELLRKAAFFPSLGNHEREAPLWHEVFNAPAPYYAFNWGKSHFSVLNTDIGNVGPGPETRDRFWREQVDWLKHDLERNQSADFRFVVGHHPPMTAVTSRQGDNPHMIALMPLLEQYQVTAAFFGHDHNYQHYLNNGVHYFITGGGGAPLYDVDTPPAAVTQKVVKTENFMVVKIEGKTVRFEAVRPDGETIEVTEIKEPN